MRIIHKVLRSIAHVDIENKTIYGNKSKLDKQVYSELKELWKDPNFSKYKFPFSYNTKEETIYNGGAVKFVRTEMTSLKDDWKYERFQRGIK